MTSPSTNDDIAGPQEATLSLLQLWQLPMAIASHWVGLMLEAATMMASHPHGAHHQPHDQLPVPPEIEAESEQCLFA